ncbi:hypothetical protein HWV62_19437 [Athelia sp. TMB]|nr:hypothetical protein HWV62_19437 [Athelia sp. TMB]
MERRFLLNNIQVTRASSFEACVLGRDGRYSIGGGSILNFDKHLAMTAWAPASRREGCIRERERGARELEDQRRGRACARDWVRGMETGEGRGDGKRRRTWGRGDTRDARAAAEHLPKHLRAARRQRSQSGVREGVAAVDAGEGEQSPRERAARLVDASARAPAVRGADGAVEGAAPYFYELPSRSLAPKPVGKRRNGAHLEGGEPENLDAAALEFGDLCIRSDIFFSGDGSAGIREDGCERDAGEMKRGAPRVNATDVLDQSIRRWPVGSGTIQIAIRKCEIMLLVSVTFEGGWVSNLYALKEK